MASKMSTEGRDKIMASHFLGHAQRNLEHMKTSITYAIRNCDELEKSKKFLEMMTCLTTFTEGLAEVRSEVNKSIIELGLRKPHGEQHQA